MKGTTVARVWRAEFGVSSDRVIEGRAVPYGTAERVSDDGVTAYLEEWQRGVFSSACSPAQLGRMQRYMSDAEFVAYRDTVERRAARVSKLNWTHDQNDPLNWIGKPVRLEERDDGLYGVWKVDETERGDFVLYKVGDGQVTGLSIGARVLETTTRGAVKVRTLAVLDHVAVVEEPAFDEARILASRARLEVDGARDKWDAYLRRSRV